MIPGIIDDCVHEISEFLPIKDSILFAQLSKECHDMIDKKNPFLDVRNKMSRQVNDLTKEYDGDILSMFKYIDNNHSLSNCGLARRLCAYHLIRILAFFSKTLDGPQAYYKWETIFNYVHDYFEEKDDFYFQFKRNDVTKLGVDFTNHFMDDWKAILPKFKRGFFQDILFIMQFYPLLKF